MKWFYAGLRQASQTPFIFLYQSLLACGALLAAAYGQFVLGLEPCILCMLQRGVWVALLVFSGVAYLHRPLKRGYVAYAVMNVAIASLGALLAGRQVYLEWAQDPAAPCLPQWGYVVQLGLSLKQWVEMLFFTPSRCGEVGFYFLGYSLAMWSLILFAVLGLFNVVYAVYLWRRRTYVR